METPENSSISKLNNSQDCQESTELAESIHHLEEKEGSPSMNNYEKAKSLNINLKQKKMKVGFQAPKKTSAEMESDESLKNDKDVKSEKKKPKKSGETQEGDESKEVKPKKSKKSVTKQKNCADKQKDPVKLKKSKIPNVAHSVQAPPSNNSIQTPASTDCSKDSIATEVKGKGQKKTEKKDDCTPAKSLSDEEWEQLFQSAINRVRSTPSEQLFKQDEEPEQNVVSLNENEVQNNHEQNEVEDSKCRDADLEDDSGVKVSISKPEVVGPEQIQENSGNHDLPVVNEHIQMIECEQVQELNENTPEGSELEFNGEEDKKHQHTPVVQLKKAIKKADRSSAAKILAPRQLQFPKPTEDCEKPRKKKDCKEIENEEKKTSDEIRKKEKGEKILKNENDKDYTPKSKKQMLMEREIEETGTWVQCSKTTCHKWRLLQDINDPTEIDERWTCDMNKDSTYNSCEKAEQDYDESEHFYTKYSEGSIVWARMVGYPWWPAMVEIDPDTETFFELVSENSMFPSHYHVVYLDNKVSRAWVKASAILPFHHRGEDLNKSLYLTKRSKGPNFKKEIDAATQNALSALELPTKERLKQFGFSVRYKGKWGEDEVKSKKIRKHCRVKLTPKNSKKKLKKPKEHTTGKQQELVMYMLDSSTVDEMLSEEPESVLKGIEEVLDSLGSEILSDVNDFVPTISEDKMFTESTETRKDVSPLKKPKGIKRKSTCNEGGTKVSKKSGKQKDEDVYGKTLEERKGKVKTIKRRKVKNAENNGNFPVENAEMKTNDCSLSKSDACDTINTVSARENHLAMKFDSDIFTMELNDEEVENPPNGRQKSNYVASNPPFTPERKYKSEAVAKPKKKKTKKNLFAVPETISNGKALGECTKNSPDETVFQNKSFTKNASSSNKEDLLENKTLEATEITSEEIPSQNNEKCTKKDDGKVVQKKMPQKKKACSKKVSFSAPATVTVELKTEISPVNNDNNLLPCNDEQTVPDIHSQESDEENGLLLDLPVCENNSEIQEIKITSVSTLPAAVDTEDMYDSDPFDLMEE
ncbi:uncharacterized protein LOC132549360 [Ylistrum balloti]|uniref:uncharacterized protein LOC132549360 n=1 Tax=Ylistrum balloti TaxID=509963 RepID=UPI002905D46F|nr:uncharacterized protein LOC132549360 [Ylistrum balloti]